MNTIIFKNYFLSKNLYWLFGIGIIVNTIILLETKISTSSFMTLSSFIFGFGSFFLFYINKLEPHFIKFNNDEFTVDFFNKAIFKNKPKTYNKEKITTSLKNGVLILSNNSTSQAIIREKALSAEDWKYVKEYFQIK
jgi:hypothetical protein